MNTLIADLLFIANIACTPTPITTAEAKVLAIHAAYASGVSTWFVLNAAYEKDQYDRNGIEFRVFAVNQDRDTSSNLAGWFTVDTVTAALTDPIMDGKPIRLPSLKDEQRQLRVLHCQDHQ